MDAGDIIKPEAPVDDGLSALSPNFSFLRSTDPLLVQLGARAERYVFEDPVTALFKLRQFGEALARRTAAETGLYAAPDEPQHDLLRRLRDRRVVDHEVADLFHALRKTGNRAVHAHEGSEREALHHLRIAWRLAVWFQQAFIDPAHDRALPSRSFVPPPDPARADRALGVELEQLRAAAVEQDPAARRASAREKARLRGVVKASSKEAWRDLAVALDVHDSDAREARLTAASQAHTGAVQASAAAIDVDALIRQAQDATRALDLDESETRVLIDAQLREAGWEADSVAISYGSGARPTGGRALAIAEWPTAHGPADYVLFVGLAPIAVVEAKRQSKDVPAAIDQSKRYSKGYIYTGEPAAAGGPWGDYGVPFLFATNGRRYLRQLDTKSGIWFLDARRTTNHPRALEGWYTPAGLTALLEQDHAEAEARLHAEPPDALPLRDYQKAAITAVEAAIASGQQDMLVAMATGTGKTRLALCLVYRLLATRRFRRILFLVDRTALGEQAQGAFSDVRLDGIRTLTDIYDVKGLGVQAPEHDTRLHVATVQGMARRVVYATDDATVPVDWYDCIVIDECHRGYVLDREMSDGELQFRTEQDYISTYRRVLDHFDAVRIGLTATPALHTTEIFGKPVYEYGYRQAVIDGHLIDHEPPIRILTTLNQAGIHWDKGVGVKTWDPATRTTGTWLTPDEVDIDVDGFNTQVLTESFNRVVCRALAQEIDPSLPGKTMVFCATDDHANRVVDLLKEAFEEAYGPLEDDAVQKITGQSDRPLELLRRYKNERLPNVAVTVDLLTTGIDVPEIVNIVFLRRVKSRILYEQMMGRATRLCPEIDKETFRVFDAVDLYAALEPYTDMKPVVTRPMVSFEQLTRELLDPAADAAHKRSVVEQITAKLQARRRLFQPEHHEAIRVLAGRSVDDVLAVLKTGDVDKVGELFRAHGDLARYLDRIRLRDGRLILISEHEDAFQGTERGYGNATKPEDYLSGFGAWLEEHQNAIDALLVVTQRPRDLTRAQLRALKLRLDQDGYSESALRTAWAEVSNQDIAASIIGFIRQQALGAPLVPYEQRVARALQRVLASQPWTTPQRRWLDRIGKQLQAETVVDREALDRGQFKAEGGFDRLNKVFGGKLEQVLGDIHEEVWRDAG